MVSKKLKTKFAIEKTKRAGKVLFPIFKKEYVSDFANEMLREDEELRRQILENPQYKGILEQTIAQTFKKYKGVLNGSKLVDSWDKVTSAVGLASDAVGPFSSGLGNLVSAGEEIPELIPKALYSVYYGIKTKDLKAIPYWTAVEAASFIPYLGDAIDMSNIYVDRARRITKKKVKEEMEKILSSSLEKKVA